MKYTKERHIVFQEANVTEILVDWLKQNGEKGLPAPEEIEFSFDKYKQGNEITLMFDDITEPEVPGDIWSDAMGHAELENLRYDAPGSYPPEWPLGPIMVKEGGIK